MNKILILAGKEIKDGLRNRWVVMIALAMAGLALALALLGSTPTGSTKVSALAVTIVSLSSLSIFFIPLISLLLSYDAIVGEDERGTLLLLLAYPITRWQIIVGKFLGHLVLLSAAIILGYGFAGVAIALTSQSELNTQTWNGYLGLMQSSILLGAVFLAIGLAISTWVRERGTAAAIAVGIWLLFVLVYDMALLGILAADSSQTLSNGVVSGLLLANPTDAYRMLNLFGSSDVTALSGLTSLGASHAPATYLLFGSLLLWAALPLIVACVVFQRRLL